MGTGMFEMNKARKGIESKDARFGRHQNRRS